MTHEAEFDYSYVDDDAEIVEEEIENDMFYAFDEDDEDEEESQDDPNAKYPHIHVRLVGQNGNALNLIGLVKQGLREGGVSREECDVFMKEAMAGGYTNVLMTCTRWVTVL